MNLREAAEQALDALELGCTDHEGNKVDLVGPAITALRAALAEDAMQRLTDVQQMIESHIGDDNKMVATSQESRQVEPVAWLIEAYDIYEKCTLQRLVFDKPKNMQGVKITAYYIAPPKREPLSFAGVKITEVRLPENMAMRFDGDVLVIEKANDIGGEE